MTAKSANDIFGFEYDWLASDADGQVALFSTAGGGWPPPEFLQDTDAHDAAIDAILALSASTKALKAPEVAPELQNTWRMMAERGLYAFDSDPHGGPYRLVAIPEDPISVADLPEDAVEVLRRLTLPHIRFAEVEQ